ncbi:ribosomal protein S5 domain 2-type protein [Lipomyces japonicus]|uniref:ribosomal protein S5 domain 2-type protein n=1 Tax=Lipomyces japonicus TaxID=56871 RepID=UPI0034CFC353
MAAIITTTAAPSPWTTPRSSPPPLVFTIPPFPGPDELIPAAKSLSDVYPGSDLPSQSLRWQALSDKFKLIYKRPVSFVTRSPGRVNVIGEHIDYSWFPVLPIAMAQDALVAVAIARDPADDATVEVANVDDQAYDSVSFDLSDFSNPFFQIKHTSHWTAYVLAGIKGALTFSKLCSTDTFKPLPKLRILIDSNVPVYAGLSSSSALVCSTILAVLAATCSHPPLAAVEKSFLVNSAVIAERALGINSGGMDQTASVFGVRDSSVFVDFRPLLSPMPIPVSSDLVFVLANSKVVSKRADIGPSRFNVRVVETTLAAEILAKRWGAVLDIRDGFGGTLRGLYDSVCEREGWQMGTRASEEHAMREIVKRIRTEFWQKTYSLSEICQMLSITPDMLQYKYMTRFPISAQSLNLRDRAIHVLEEAFRVKCFSAMLSDGNRNMSALGSLMNASHNSCATLYECSCPEVDDLVGIARKHGAEGSRITGTGWGGCSVTLVRAEKLHRVMTGLRQDYYKVRGFEPDVIVVRPATGASVASWPGL